MPTLYLLRHAKAEKPVKHAWDPADDRNRPLTASGIADAKTVGSWFAARGLIPGIAVVSPAIRALQTWQLAANELKYAVPLRQEPALYEASDAEILKIIRGIPSEFTSAILVGHNPSISDFLDLDLPTCSLARVELANWNAATPGPKGVKVWRIRANGD